MRFLMGKEELEGLRTDFVDSWLAVNEEPTPRSNVTKEQDEMLTFPSDAPSKRIDFVFVRGQGASAVRKAWLVGQEPLEGVGKKLDGDGNHIGMVHSDSQLW